MRPTFIKCVYEFANLGSFVDAWRMVAHANKYLSANPSRSVMLHGALWKNAALRLAAEIQLLRKRSQDPIIVHIRSGGGEVDVFYDLVKLFKAEEHGATGHKIITIGHNVRSAATYLLVIGHYAYAAKATKLHFHGVRCRNGKGWKTSTREKSLALAIKLDSENRKIAMLMTGKVYPRLAARYLGSKVKISPKKPHRPLILLERFIQEISEHLSSDKPRKLLYEAFDRLRLLSGLKPQLFPTRKLQQTACLAANEAALYQAIIAFELGDNRENGWALRPEVAAEMMMDYFLARDILHGAGFSFSPSPVFEPGSKMGLIDWHLQCLSLAFCQRLLMGEHAIDANDAYWLGLIDDVLDQ